MRRTDNEIDAKTGAVDSGMREYKTKAAGRLTRLAFYMAMGVLLTGCGLSEGSYTKEELGNLAKLEVYEAGSDTLIKTIEDDETLYQYNQAETASEDAYTENELEESAEEAGETYYIVAYKYPAAKFGNKEPQKYLTITLFDNMNIAKMTVAEETVKNIPLSEDLLTFYYEMSEEESTFYTELLAGN